MVQQNSFYRDLYLAKFLNIDLKIILLDHQNNYVERFSVDDND